MRLFVVRLHPPPHTLPGLILTGGPSRAALRCEGRVELRELESAGGTRGEWAARDAGRRAMSRGETNGESTDIEQQAGGMP